MTFNKNISSKEEIEKKILNLESGIFSTLNSDGMTRINYSQIVKIAKNFFKCLFIEIDVAEVKLIKDNLDNNIALVNSNKKISKTTAHVYRRVLISCGKKTEEFIVKNSLSQQYKILFGREYKTPFAILEDNVQFDSVIGGADIIFPKKDQIIKFMAAVQSGTPADRFLINILYYIGLSPNQICNLKHNSITIKDDICYLKYSIENETIEVAFNDILMDSYIAYILDLIRINNKKSSEIKNSDYLFINRVGKQYNLKGISNIIIKYRDSAIDNNDTKITSNTLIQIAEARKYYFAEKKYSEEMRKYFKMTQLEYSKIERKILREIKKYSENETYINENNSAWLMVKDEFENPVDRKNYISNQKKIAILELITCKIK